MLVIGSQLPPTELPCRASAAVVCARRPKNFVAIQPAFPLPASNQPIAILQPSPDESIQHIPSTRPARNLTLSEAFAVYEIYFSSESKDDSGSGRHRAI